MSYTCCFFGLSLSVFSSFACLDLTRHFNFIAIPPFWRPLLGGGIRFGEAQNPGPDQLSSFGFCVVNPTTLNQRADVLLDLMRHTKCQVLTCSETSATAQTQKSFTGVMRKQQLSCFWSPPVVPMRSTVTGTPSARGQASGVAMVTSLPCRYSRLAFPEEWLTTTRVLHTILQLGCSHVQLFIVYCKPLNNPQSMDFNNELLRFVTQHAALTPLPYMILGDFNCKPEDFEVWSNLAARGFQHLGQIYEKKYAQKMPVTSMSATQPDNAILSPQLVELVGKIDVMDTSWLPTHQPVHFDIRMPSNGLFCHRLRFPKSFVSLGVSEDDLAKAITAAEPLEEVATLTEWGAAVESLVEKALQMNSPGATLPKAFKGRCKPAPIVRAPVHLAVKKASSGDYEPPAEVLTMATRRKVKQMRRIDSLLQRVRKLERQGAKTPMTRQEIQHEWNVVLTDHSFGSSFLHWVMSLHIMDFPHWPFPTANWLSDLSVMVKHFVDSSVYHDAKVRRSKLEYMRVLDQRCSHKQAFAQVRGPGNPPLTELVESCDFEAICVPDGQPLRYDLFADTSAIRMLDLSLPITVNGSPCRILDCHDTHVLVESPQLLVIPPDSSVQVAQSVYTADGSGVSTQLNRFWLPIWQREPMDLSFLDSEEPAMDFPVLRGFLQQPDIPVNMTDVTQWQAAIKKLRSGSARGIDGISAQELKMLPVQLIQMLANIMDKMIAGFDECMMVGLTCPLAKVSSIPTRDQTRPITILAQLYRLWAAVATQQITKHLASTIPSDVTGLLPRRGAAETAYLFQFSIEQAKSLKLTRTGLTLDIKKCFNHMIWSFVHAALVLLGVPRKLLGMWFRSLARLDRKWILTGQVFDAGACSTGLPEGDVWSVVSMIAVAHFWALFLRKVYQLAGHSSDTLMLSAYADNWAWVVEQPIQHRSLLQATLDFLGAAGLTLDIAKTWFWITQTNRAAEVTAVLEAVLPGKPIAHKSTSADLGFQLHYSGGFRKGIRQQRVDKGIDRLKRIKTMPHDIVTKCKLVRVSVFPAALYGCAIRPPSQDTLDHLRSMTAQAVMGYSQSLSAAISLLLAPKGNLDPEFWTWCAVFKTARAFLLGVPHDVKLGFLSIASQFTGQLANVKGPATAFAHILQQIGWFIDASGIITVDGFLKLDICANSFQRFKRLMQHAWEEQLVMQKTQRKSWYSYPDIDMVTTRAVLNRFNPHHQKKIIREISGGYQTHVQKSKWVSGDTGICPYCEEEDTREHMLVRCPVGADVRAPFETLLTWLDDSGSEFAAFPFITVHPLLQAIRCACFALTVPDFPQAALDFAHSQQALGIPVHWFTDGSCANSVACDYRHSAFSIVLDLCHDDPQRVHEANIHLETLGFPSTFQKILACRTPGEQDILRAEMTAAAVVIVQVGYGTIHVDNQTAVQLLNLALTTDDITLLCNRDHFDILLQVWNVRHRVSCSVVKIAAHENLTKVM